MPLSKKKSTPPPLRPRTGCIGAPDVTVNVGGRKFLEHSKFLRCWSEVFDRNLQKVQKEGGKTKVFTFPDKEPEEWELLIKILSPFNRERVTIENYEIVLAWCEELRIPAGLAECDRILATEVLKRDGDCDEDFLDKVIDILPKSIQSDLPRTERKCLEHIKKAFDQNSLLLTEQRLKVVLSFVAMYEDLDYETGREELWDCFESLLPANFPDERSKQHALMDNDLFPVFIHARLHERILAENEFAKMVNIVNDMDQISETTVKMIGILDNIYGSDLAEATNVSDANLTTCC